MRSGVRIRSRCADKEADNGGRPGTSNDGVCMKEVSVRSISSVDLKRTAWSAATQLLLTVGYVLLLLAVYELWVSDIVSGQLQQSVAQDLRRGWVNTPSGPTTGQIAPIAEPAAGQPFGFLHVPRLGRDWSRAILEGTDPLNLDRGPGHYVGSAMPGQLGNFALAGHRVGRGSSFLDIDKLRPGDPIVVETASAWYVYRVLGNKATGDFTGDPSGIPGQQIVAPTEVDVISPTPGGAAAGPASGAYLTLTTCNPRYSARQRLIVHAGLDGPPISRAANADGPVALREG